MRIMNQFMFPNRYWAIDHDRDLKAFTIEPRSMMDDEESGYYIDVICGTIRDVCDSVLNDGWTSQWSDVYQRELIEHERSPRQTHEPVDKSDYGFAILFLSRDPVIMVTKEEIDFFIEKCCRGVHRRTRICARNAEYFNLADRSDAWIIIHDTDGEERWTFNKYPFKLYYKINEMKRIIEMFENMKKEIKGDVESEIHQIEWKMKNGNTRYDW